MLVAIFGLSAFLQPLGAGTRSSISEYVGKTREL